MPQSLYVIARPLDNTKGKRRNVRISVPFSAQQWMHQAAAPSHNITKFLTDALDEVLQGADLDALAKAYNVPITGVARAALIKKYPDLKAHWPKPQWTPAQIAKAHRAKRGPSQPKPLAERNAELA